MAGEWSLDEVDRTIDVYFSMLALELEGVPFNKTEFRKGLMQDVDRSAASFEFKFRNISAAIADLGGVFVDGYKPAQNAQQLLRDRVRDRFEREGTLRQLMLKSVEAPADVDDHVLLGEASPVPVVEPPVPSDDKVRTGRHIDFQRLEERNRTLGLAGELSVLELERRRLTGANRLDLADRVRHVAKVDGDGLGYDVLSFAPDGSERFIEVKTTRYARELPFIVSSNEVEFSAEFPEKFVLYRVFRFGKSKVGHYELPGALSDTSHLMATSFKGFPRTAIA